MKCPSLEDLPPAPNGRVGWPWTTESQPFDFLGSGVYEKPLISIVVPTFNHGLFIEETIRSVLLQNYPAIELIIIDGGSNDGTLEIIHKYEKWITHWRSEKDDGQVDAITKGFDIAKGDIFNWLNSDDFLLPNALEFVAIMKNAVPDAEIIMGARLQITENGVTFRVQDSFAESKDLYLLGVPDFPQETTFFTADLYRKTGLDLRLHYIFDTAFHWRALKFATSVACSRIPLAKFRVYKAMKTLRLDARKANELKILSDEYTFRRPLVGLILLCHRYGLVGLIAKFVGKLRRRKVLEVLYDASLSDFRVQKYF